MSLNQETADIIDALETALDTIKGEGWSNESLKAIKGALDALNNLSLAEIESSLVLAKEATLGLVDAKADAIDTKTQNLPVDPASEGLVENAIEAAHGVTDGKIDAVQSGITNIAERTDNLPDDPASEGGITAAHGVTDGKIDAAQADITSIKGTVAALPTLVDLEASEVLALEADVETAITAAHSVTDGKVDAVQADVTAIKAATDNLPAVPASQGDVNLAHATTDGKIDAVQSDATAIKARTDNLPAVPASQGDVTGAHVVTNNKVDAVQAEVLAVKAKTDLIPAQLAGLLYAVGGGPYALSDDVLFADDELASKDSADYVKAKEVNVGYLTGTLRIAFDSRDPSGLGHWVHACIYKNGVALGTERSQNGEWYTYTEDLEFAKNDLVQIYVKNSDVGFPTEVRNFRILGKYPVPTLPASIAVP